MMAYNIKPLDFKQNTELRFFEARAMNHRFLIMSAGGGVELGYSAPWQANADIIGKFDSHEAAVKSANHKWSEILAPYLEHETVAA